MSLAIRSPDGNHSVTRAILARRLEESVTADFATALFVKHHEFVRGRLEHCMPPKTMEQIEREVDNLGSILAMGYFIGFMMMLVIIFNAHAIEMLDARHVLLQKAIANLTTARIVYGAAA